MKNTQQFFDAYYKEEIPFNVNDVDSLIGYFQKRGFSYDAAVNTAMVLLRQASKDKLNAQELIATLKGITDIQLSNIVAQILNMERDKTSQLGIKVSTESSQYDIRNIVI